LVSKINHGRGVWGYKATLRPPFMGSEGFGKNVLNANLDQIG